MDGPVMRLPPLDESDLSEEQEALRRSVVGTRTGLGEDVWQRGPFGVWQHAAGVGQPSCDLGAAVRFETQIPGDLREAAICTVGAFYKSKFEFAAHKAIGMAEGLSSAALDRLAEGESPGWTEGLDAVHRYTISLLEQHMVTEELHSEIVALLGYRGAVELVTTIGYYSLISLTLNAFDVQLPTDMTDPWPMR